MLVIGHRGSPGYGAENTIAGFRRAIELGADGVELDLILTADDQLVVFHDWTLNRLAGEEQLIQRFPDRSRNQDGKRVWLTRDFTLNELNSLVVIQQGPCAVEREDPFADPDRHLCSYADALDAIRELRESHPKIVLYTEIKTDSAYMDKDEVDLIARLVSETLSSAGEPESPKAHWLQSFDGRVMEQLAADRTLTEFKKCQLISCEPGLIASSNPVILDVSTITSTKDLRDFLKQNVSDKNLQMVHGWKLMWWYLLDQKGIDCVAVAHDLGLEIHAFTFRDERYKTDYNDKPVLAPQGSAFESAIDEVNYFRSRGFDAIMSDCIKSAI